MTATARVKLTHIITRLDRGGSAEVAMELAARLDRDRYDTRIVTGHTVEPVYDLEAFSEQTGIPITILPRLRRDINLLDDIAACRDLTRLLKQSQPDVVHTHTSKAGILGRIAAKIAGTPVVVHAPHGHIFHGYFDRFTSRFFILLEKLMARGTDRIITLTDLGKRDHITYGIAPENRFATIPCAIDLSRFRDAEKSG
ncbi:MAG: glycosyltransferase, partial [Candidatus Latescibacteria bacterium]|nr:glycosyltransferase [Candidatus Latescibacterota bacterium]